MKKLIYLSLFLFPGICFAEMDCNTRNNVPSEEMTLESVINLGLCRNPTTAAAYLSAESARLSKNAGYAPYLPNVSASASMSKQYRNKEWTDDWATGASVSASWLIFDFGKRFSDLSALAKTWQATGFDYDDSVQNYVYGIIGSYYALLNADADVATMTELLEIAKTSKNMADKKFKAGAVAKADVLKADVILAGRELDLERAKNNREIAKGSLLTRLSFSAEQDIKIKSMPSEFGSETENKSVEELLAIAKKQRPDLLSATASKDAAWHRRNSRFLSNLPSISLSGSVSWNDTPSDVFNAGSDNISGQIGIRASMPIFAGFANVYGVRAAHANYERAIEMERMTADNAKLDVFSAFQNYKTAQNVLKQSEVFLKSSLETEKVVSGMYKVGRATMLEWQQSQADLADAEKQNNAAKYDLFVKRAAVALAIGDISVGIQNDK